MLALTWKQMRVLPLTRALAIALFVVATAISARLRIVLPFSPVPLTLQVLTVVLSGLVLGSRGGFVAQIVYLQAILLGAPWTASGIGGPAAFLAPTAGYLIAFPVAAALAGLLSERAGRATLGRALGSLVALAVIYGLGGLWLSRYVGGLGAAWALGVAPFLGVDALKLVLANAALVTRRS